MVFSQDGVGLYLGQEDRVRVGFLRGVSLVFAPSAFHLAW